MEDKSEQPQNDQSANQLSDEVCLRVAATCEYSFKNQPMPIDAGRGCQRADPRGRIRVDSCLPFQCNVCRAKPNSVHGRTILVSLG